MIGIEVDEMGIHDESANNIKPRNGQLKVYFCF